MNRFPSNLRKGAPLPENIYADSTICVSFEIPNRPEYVAATRGLIADLGKWYFWEKDGYGSTRARDAAEYVRQIIHRSLCIVPCSDDSAQIRMMIYQLERHEVVQINNIRVSLYEQSGYSAINANCPPVFSGSVGDPYGPDALCGAVDAYVKRILVDTLNRYKVGLGLTSVGVGILTWAVGPLAAIIGGIVIIIEAVTIADLESAMGDQAAVDEIVCQLRDRLSGQTTTKAAFESAINALTPVGQHQTTIADVLKATRSYTENFALFVDILGNAHVQASQGTALPCPCQDGNWCYTIDFTLGDGGFVHAATSSGRPYGVYVPGTGWQQTSYPDSPGDRAINIALDIPDVNCEITTMVVHTIQPFRFSAVGVDPQMIALGYPESLASRFRMVPWPQAQQNYLNLGFTLPTHIVIDLYNPSGHESSGILSRVTIYGTGQNPFGGSNCD